MGKISSAPFRLRRKALASTLDDATAARDVLAMDLADEEAVESVVVIATDEGDYALGVIVEYPSSQVEVPSTVEGVTVIVYTHWNPPENP